MHGEERGVATFDPASVAFEDLVEPAELTDVQYAVDVRIRAVAA